MTFTVKGEKRFYHNVIAPIIDAGKIRGILGMNVDITERKRAEEALRQSEQRYRTLAESTRDIIYIVDREGTLLYANQTASAYTGLNTTDIVGKRQADLFPPEMAATHVARVEQVFENR